jgi:hypothetical protein
MSRRSSAAAFAVSLLGAAVVFAAPAQAQMLIALGQSLSGQLSTSDRRLADGSIFDEYRFNGQAGQTIVVDMISSDLDSYVLLWDQNGNELARDDDSGEGLNSQLTYTLPYTGLYRIIANTYGAGARYGSYTISLRLQGMALAMGQPQPVGQPQPLAQPTALVTPSTAPVAGMIGVNQQVTGNLTTADPRYNGKPFQVWGFQCSAGLPLQLDILSSWDNYALLFDPMGNEAARDDDGGDEGLNARIAHTCALTGMYRITVTTFSSGTTPGIYTLQVRSTGTPVALGQPQPLGGQPQPLGGQPQPLGGPQPLGQPEPQAQPGVTLPQPITQGAMPITGRVPDPGQIGQIQIGWNVQGRLETGDQEMNDGTWADVWQFQGQAGRTVTIELRSEEFDTYLQLLDAQGNRLAEDDDSLGNLDSSIVFRLPATGMYQIVVNNFSDERRSGLYTLSLR